MELRAETSVFDDKLLKEDIDNAQETADNAQVIAGTTAQYFWFLEEIGSVPEGVGTGAHITNLTKEEFLSNPANGGGNLLARSNGIAIRDGLTELAYFSGTAAQIGKSNSYNSYFDAQSFQIRNGSTLLSKFTSNGTDIYLANDSANSVASFGTTVRIGKSNSYNSYFDAQSFQIRNGSTLLASFSGTAAQIGKSNSYNSYFDAQSFQIRDGLTELASFRSNKIQLGKNSTSSEILMCGDNVSLSTSTDTISGVTLSKVALEMVKSLPARGGNVTSIISRNENNINSYAECSAFFDNVFGSKASLRANDGEGQNAEIYAMPGAAWMLTIGDTIASFSIVNVNTLKWATFEGIDRLASPVALTVTSDRRLKEHIKYLDDDAVKFVQKLKPALYKKDRSRHMGFYAQDVQQVNIIGADITPQIGNFLGLTYEDLIAPLVAYCQHLEKRIEQIEGRTT